MTKERSITGEFGLQFKTLLGIVVGLWVLELIDIPLGGSLNRFGIHPREISGLWGIVFAPFLHGDLLHLLSNTVPFVVLSWLIMLRETADWLMVTLIVGFISGLGVWLVGQPGSVHIGASGVIFGYFGFLLARGYYERSFVSIAFSVLVTFLYGGLIFGVLPGQSGISWEGHLFGFIGGIVAAKLMSSPRKRPNNFDI
ncbi:MAG: rhomboid family intramembrane serine protease [Cyanobacteria bacterium P01_C01_bin.121]